MGKGTAEPVLKNRPLICDRELARTQGRCIEAALACQAGKLLKPARPIEDGPLSMRGTSGGRSAANTHRCGLIRSNQRHTHVVLESVERAGGVPLLARHISAFKDDTRQARARRIRDSRKLRASLQVSRPIAAKAANFDARHLGHVRKLTHECDAGGRGILQAHDIGRACHIVGKRGRQIGRVGVRRERKNRHAVKRAGRARYIRRTTLEVRCKALVRHCRQRKPKRPWGALVNASLQLGRIRNERPQRHLVEKAVTSCDLDSQTVAHQHRIRAFHVEETSKTAQIKHARLIEQAGPTFGRKQKHRMALGFQGFLDTPRQRRDARIESSDKHKMQVRVHVVHQKLQLEQLAKRHRMPSRPLRPSMGTEYGMTVRILP